MFERRLVFPPPARAADGREPLEEAVDRDLRRLIEAQGFDAVRKAGQRSQVMGRRDPRELEMLPPIGLGQEESLVSELAVLRPSHAAEAALPDLRDPGTVANLEHDRGGTPKHRAKERAGHRPLGIEAPLQRGPLHPFPRAFHGEMPVGLGRFFQEGIDRRGFRPARPDQFAHIPDETDASGPGTDPGMLAGARPIGQRQDLHAAEASGDAVILARFPGGEMAAAPHLDRRRQPMPHFQSARVFRHRSSTSRSVPAASLDRRSGTSRRFAATASARGRTRRTCANPDPGPWSAGKVLRPCACRHPP